MDDFSYADAQYESYDQGYDGTEDVSQHDLAIVLPQIDIILQPAQASTVKIVVTDAPRFDLVQYIGNYTGHLKIHRLLRIGQNCKPLAPDAYKAAIILLKKTLDIPNYKLAVKGLAGVSPSDPDAVLDDAWVEQVNKTIKSTADKLEGELKGYKNNMIKDSIRMGHEELGHHYYLAGDLSNAMKSYARMRDYCNTSPQMIDMSMLLILVSIEQESYQTVASNVAKVRNYLRSDEVDNNHAPKLTVATGLSQLNNRAYLEAARSFISTPLALANTYSDVVTMNDVAVYGGLCALASMDREQLKTEVLESVSFRSFLELEPHIRRAVAAFYSARYGECLSILDAYKNDYLLDIFLQKHVETIYERVRTKSIVQYFVPFNTVTLEVMAKAFDTEETKMEKELIGLIERNYLKARVDTQNRLIVSKESQLRDNVHRNALAMAEEYERTARVRLMRINIMRAGLDIKGPKNSNMGGGMGIDPNMMHDGRGGQRAHPMSQLGHGYQTRNRTFGDRVQDSFGLGGRF